MHGDFFEEHQNEALVGGVSLLSGYIQKTKKEEKKLPLYDFWRYASGFSY